MVIVKATKASEAGELPSQQLLTEMGKFNEQLVNAGILLDAAGLHPSSRGARVHFAGNSRTVIDGPFAETKELIAGYWLWRVESLAEAIDWVKRCPNPMLEESDIEIRPLFEMEDFESVTTPEMRAHEAGLRAASLGLGTPQFLDGKEMLLAGLNREYSAATRGAIPEQWQQFAPLIGKIPGQVGSASYGVCWNTRPDCAFDYLTGVQVAEKTGLPNDFTLVTVPSGRYAVFTHASHVSTLAATIDAIWTKWAPDCGLKIAGTPCYERYTSDFNPRSGLGGMEIWIPLVSD